MTYFDMTRFTEELEQAVGPIPGITPARELFDRFERFARLTDEPLPDPHEVTRALAAQGMVPCRLPDGSLGYFGLAFPAQEKQA